MTKKEEAPVTRRFLPFRLLIAKTKKAGQARPFHPFSVNASTSVVKAFNGDVPERVHFHGRRISPSGSAASVNLWLTR
ncbi:hypothetical protein O9X91_08805 [Agrobacterium salinitolerans]|uniref:hypothetical protein n=1 Tax=Agrobacterium salinitolerans TaxID=1183413 RepID=UPI0022B81BF7|nr:hypothetical protein [Agrobacterium salinitolerans]MCZ7852076.1 hypothetical protein [Agrobacterium salinitolerans]MCZ7977687.1 hypothetical protein [Agrobacterium salinitolerans]